VLCQGLLADAVSAAASSEDRCKGGYSLGHPFDPVSIPHDIEKRGVATRIDQERNPQVSGAFQPSPQVTESARLNLSRWRHGFEPRWDYAGQRWYPPFVGDEIGDISGGANSRNAYASNAY
jgi:hypothetical protein